MAIVRLDDEQLADIRLIAEASETALDAAAAAISDPSNSTLKVSRLLKVVETRVPDPQLARAITRILVGVAALSRNSERTTLEAANLLEDSAKRLDEVFQFPDHVKKFLVVLAASRSVSLSAKAISLSLTQEKTFSDITALTDVRLVFDNPPSMEVVGAVVLYNLALEYREGSEIRSISLALDGDDVDAVIEALNRVKHKAEAAKTALSNKSGFESFIVGEETYGL